MDNEVIEDGDDINLESFGNEIDAPPGCRDRNHSIQVEDEEDEDEDDDNDASGGAFVDAQRNGFGICIDMDNEVIENDDDINLESFGNEIDAPPGFRDRNHSIQVEDEE
ncbi:uncharacterized protein LOC126704796 [Quercus robur]|uniref:uncharacterized protein LOC126704796 n=1 Tax=Quercus robur TaxID=38942 RepID=UPI0021625C52|nr:uncharacterized protein LOC126704796 [Quercus robur]